VNSKEPLFAGAVNEIDVAVRDGNREHNNHWNIARHGRPWAHEAPAGSSLRIELSEPARPLIAGLASKARFAGVVNHASSDPVQSIVLNGVAVHSPGKGSSEGFSAEVDMGAQQKAIVIDAASSQSRARLVFPILGAN
jgi:hypothetical protein